MSQLDAMLLSMAIEGPVAYGLVFWRGWSCRGPVSVALAVVFATAATHPQLWAASIWLYPRFGYEPTLLLAESVVILAEACIIHWSTALRPGPSVLVSAIANGVSALTGLVLVFSL